MSGAAQGAWKSDDVAGSRVYSGVYGLEYLQQTIQFHTCFSRTGSGYGLEFCRFFVLEEKASRQLIIPLYKEFFGYMTTVFLSDKICFVCGAKSKYPLIDHSLGNVGSRDLDGRPTHIRRSAVYLWIQRCPACGYCAPEITEGEDRDRAAVHTPDYQQLLNDKTFPETGDAFLCHAYIMKNRELFADAGWAALFAAWICDDNGFPDSARSCRGRAVDFFIASRSRQQCFAETTEEEDLYLVDLYRRRSFFDTASAMCEKALNDPHSDRIYDLLSYERELVDAKDDCAHNDAEAEELII